MLEEVQKYIKSPKIISIYDNWNIDINKSLVNQLDELDEDLIQIVFKGGYMIDIGWYPEQDEHGRFKGVLIRNENWNEPVYEIETTNVAVIIDWIQEVIECVFDFDLKH